MKAFPIIHKKKKINYFFFFVISDLLQVLKFIKAKQMGESPKNNCRANDAIKNVLSNNLKKLLAAALVAARVTKGWRDRSQ